MKNDEKIDYKRESEVLALQLHLLREEYNTLKRDYEILKYDIQDKRIVYIDTPEFEKNYIPIQKVKDKIEEYKHKDFIKMQVVMQSDKQALKIVEVLQELIEESEENKC